MESTVVQLQIHPALVEHRATLAVVQGRIVVSDSSDGLRAELEEAQRAAAASDASARNERSIATTREIVRALGWNPNRHRISSEALLRRVRKGDRVPSVNNVVDINNIVSLESGWPVGSYDVARLESPVEFRPGRAEEAYAALDGSAFKVASLALLVDRQGPFGSVVRDSGRAIIGQDTTAMLMIIVGFGGRAEVADLAQRARDLLTRFAAAASLDVAVVEGASSTSP